MIDDFTSRLFPLGKITISDSTQKLISENQCDTFLYRHQTGEWFDTVKEIRAYNTIALFGNFRIRTTHFWGKQKLWIITESNRSKTTVFLAEEYQDFNHPKLRPKR